MRKISTRMWVHEDSMSMLGTRLALRMTIVKLSDDSLWMGTPTPHNPQLENRVAEMGGYRRISFERLCFSQWRNGPNGVSFEEARTAFYDENAIQFYDPDHSDEEDRFVLLGLSLKPRVLVVCHCFRESETVIRNADHDVE